MRDTDKKINTSPVCPKELGLDGKYTGYYGSLS